MKIEAKIIKNKITRQSDFDNETAYGLMINDYIITWFGHDNVYMSTKSREEKEKEIEMYKEIVERINKGNK